MRGGASVLYQASTLALTVASLGKLLRSCTSLRRSSMFDGMGSFSSQWRVMLMKCVSGE